MADLGHRSRSRSRGQLILVTALALAAIFLGLAVIVNSAIFTENLATRNENVESTEALEYRHSVTQYMGEIVEFANEHNNSQYDYIERNVSDGTADASLYTSIQQAEDGAGLSLEKVGDREGARIYQTDGSTFEDNDTNEDWTLVTDVETTRAFTMNVSSISGSFEVIADDGTDEWSITVTDDDLNVTNPAGTSETCDYSSLDSLDITGATVNGEPCPALVDTGDGESMRLADALDDEYRIEFEDGDAIQGNYSLVVAGSNLDDAGTIQTNRNYSAVDGPGTGPYVRPAMYSARFELEYETPRVLYETDITVAPGESP
ncbi:hypothetical protein [Halobacteriaceae bacterium SHR40]|uniref:hypothetical protein n=1 Tax=Halovenus amylolytica TaxID=2500550 RepID=UPI000FE3EE12